MKKTVLGLVALTTCVVADEYQRTPEGELTPNSFYVEPQFSKTLFKVDGSRDFNAFGYVNLPGGDHNMNFYGLRIGYTYYWPNALYANGEVSWSKGNAIHPSTFRRYENGEGNIQLGYTFSPSGFFGISPYLGTGVLYRASQWKQDVLVQTTNKVTEDGVEKEVVTEKTLAVKRDSIRIWPKVAAGLRSVYALRSNVYVGLNGEAFAYVNNLNRRFWGYKAELPLIYAPQDKDMEGTILSVSTFYREERARQVEGDGYRNGVGRDIGFRLEFSRAF